MLLVIQRIIKSYIPDCHETKMWISDEYEKETVIL